MINTQKGDLISISTLLLNYSSISILLSLCQHFSSSTTMTNTDRKQLFFQRSTLLYLSFYLIISVTCSDPSYTPPDNIAINCGGHGDSVSLDGRKWTGDISSKFISSQQQQLNASSTSTASTQDFAPQIPYTTARIFHSQFTYTVPVSIAGPKFIRLHFHPASYSSLNISTAFFSISVEKYTLVHNFSTSLTAGYLNTTYFVKEFCINMVSEQSLNITFSPSPGGFAFVNGIEVVSMPANLYINGNKDVPLVGQSQTFIVDNTTALEMIYRLNVDGQAISPADDTGMFRAWSQDIDYIYGGATGQDPYHFTINISYTKVPPYTAPEILYRTARSMGMEAIVNEHYNLTWLFPVDSGFYYLVRLHFCEIAPEITGANQRVFEIFLNNQTADDQMDIMTYAGGIGVPIYRDFILMVPGTGSKEDLWLALHPNTGSRPKYPDALLNGLEIFKLNKSDGSLAGPNPVMPDAKSGIVEPFQPISDHPNKIRTTFVVAGVVLGGAVILCILLLFFVNRRRRCKKTGASGRWDPFSQSRSETTKMRSLPSHLCRQFSLSELKSATNDFSVGLLIGAGGFGNVYKGYVDDGATPVAIKRLNPASQQGAHEFRTEIEMLSQLRHLHLVSLIGYCDDDEEMILVYDYMARGTLRDHLYNTDNPPLPWKLRLRICIGAARGLHYLHTGARHTIIHRDVKTTNILLDENWVAKVSDFGLSRVGPTSVSHSHISTVVKGSFGYLDPEYFRRQQLTEKSDVYSFGVVLFEVLCARPAIDKKLEKDEMGLAEWAQAHYRRGKLDQIVDPHLRRKIAAACLAKFGEIAHSCLRDHGIKRPTMGDVVWNLEFALQLQENEDKCGAPGEITGEESTSGASSASVRTIDDYVADLSGNSTLGMSGSVFSEIMTPKGR